MSLAYFLNKKSTVVVVTFTGTIAPDDIAQLDACAKEVDAEPAEYRVLNLAGLSNVEPDCYRPFAIFQQMLRENGNLVICGLEQKLRIHLKAQGLLRDAELRNDLISALQSILSQVGKK